MTTNSEDRVRVINSVTGGAATVPRRLFEHPVFGRTWVEVKEGQKPFTPELYKAQTPEEFEATHPDKLPDTEQGEEQDPEPDLEVED